MKRRGRVKAVQTFQTSATETLNRSAFAALSTVFKPRLPSLAVIVVTVVAGDVNALKATASSVHINDYLLLLEVVRVVGSSGD